MSIAEPHTWHTPLLPPPSCCPVVWPWQCLRSYNLSCAAQKAEVSVNGFLLRGISLHQNENIFSFLSASLENLHDRDAHLQGVYRAMAIGLFCAFPVNACIFLVSEAQKRGSQSDLGLGQRQLNHMDDESLRLSCYWGVFKEACVVFFYVFFQRTNKLCVSNKFAMNSWLSHNTISTRCAAFFCNCSCEQPF